MKRFIRAFLISVVILSTFSCMSNQSQNYTEVRKGVYLYPSLQIDFPIEKGNDIIFLGEQHGDKESKVILSQLLSYLYYEHDLRDIAIEEDAVYTDHANDYINSKIEVLRKELVLRKDVLDHIRQFNSEVGGTPVKVHLVDVDSPKSAIDEHLVRISDQAILDELGIDRLNFHFVSRDHVDILFEKLKERQSEDERLPEIESLIESYNLYRDHFALTESQVQIRREKHGPVRESIITRNIMSVADQLEGKPLLVFIGGSHAMKSNQIADMTYINSTASQLIERGLKVHSIYHYRLSGRYNWRGRQGLVRTDPAQIVFGDGVTLKDILADSDDFKAVRLDLNHRRNRGISLNELGLHPGTGHLVYDEIILVNEATAME